MRLFHSDEIRSTSNLRGAIVRTYCSCTKKYMDGYGLIVLSRHHTHSVMSIHLLPSAIIHCPLLQLKLTNALSNCNALRDRTIRILAMLSVNPQQGPNSLANLASARCFHL